MKSHAALGGNLINDRMSKLGAERQHRSENFADWSEIVVSNPTSKTQELLIKNRSCIKNVEDRFCLDRRFAFVQLDDNATQALLAERHKHASAHDWSQFRRHAVSKYHVERHGESNIAKG